MYLFAKYNKMRLRNTFMPGRPGKNPMEKKKFCKNYDKQIKFH